jgi:hypothetical protein
VDLDTAVLVAAAALALVYVLGRRRKLPALHAPVGVAQQERGFLSVPRRHRLFDYKSVIVADERGTTEIDVIVVGNSGVFVVELKDFNAWIFGSEDDEQWTACYFDKSRHQFQNPLRQNFRHIKALQARLGLRQEVFQSVVAFTGNCELKTPMPSTVVMGSYRRVVESAEGIKLTDAEVMRVCQVLEVLEAASTNDALDAHVADLKVRYSSTTTCPKCGAALVARRARNAAVDEPGFLGCQSYPRCRYTRQL